MSQTLLLPRRRESKSEGLNWWTENDPDRAEAVEKVYLVFGSDLQSDQNGLLWIKIMTPNLRKRAYQLAALNYCSKMFHILKTVMLTDKRNVFNYVKISASIWNYIASNHNQVIRLRIVLERIPTFVGLGVICTFITWWGDLKYLKREAFFFPVLNSVYQMTACLTLQLSNLKFQSKRKYI